MKQVQISEELFMMLVRYHLLDEELMKGKITTGLEKKIDAMVNRELYSKYKTAPSKEEKEKARKEYLDRKGYHEDFRW